VSLCIETTRVAAVLLADGWHTIQRDSLVIDAYEFGTFRDPDNPDVLDVDFSGGGHTGVCAAGFRFREFVDGQRIDVSGPMTAILAVTEQVRA